MRLHGVLADLLGSPARVKVVRALVRESSTGRTGREIARAARCSAPQALQALSHLEAVGFVTRKALGRAHEWALVEDHVLVAPVRALFEAEADLPDRFRRDLRAELSPLPLRSAILFGSIAKGSETNESDADLFLETSGATDEGSLQQALTPIARRFIRHYGIVISPFIQSSTASGRHPNPNLIREIRDEGVPLLTTPA